MATFSKTTEKTGHNGIFLLIIDRISLISNGVKCLEYGTNVQPVAKTKWSILINILSTIHARSSNDSVHSILSVPAFILAMWWLVASCANYICFVYVCMRVTCATVKKMCNCSSKETNKFYSKYFPYPYDYASIKRMQLNCCAWAFECTSRFETFIKLNTVANV